MIPPPARRCAVRRHLAVAVVAWTAAACASASTSTENRPPASAARAAVQTEITSAHVDTPASTVQRPRVLLIGDSTLLAVEHYRAFDALAGFDYVLSAESCRTLGVPSCGQPPVPANAVDTITAATGPFDIVVVMAGYDEWWTSFPSSFDRVVAAARAQGARHIVWLTYREGVGYVSPDGASANEAFVRNNATVHQKVGGTGFDDVVVADWAAYSAASGRSADPWLTADGIHLTATGSYAVADYIARTVASISGLPCPRPWVHGDAPDDPCPNPDVHGPVADIAALYP